MTDPVRFERLCDDVGELRVAFARVEEQVRTMARAGPDGDRRLERRVNRLSERVDALDERVDELQAWRWKLIGAAGAVATIASILFQAGLQLLGGHGA